MCDPRPHPNPLPRGEGESFAVFWHFESQQLHKANPQNLECATPVPSPGGEGQGEGGRETNLAPPREG
jgi:hypothetical protein